MSFVSQLFATTNVDKLRALANQTNPQASADGQRSRRHWAGNDDRRRHLHYHRHRRQRRRSGRDRLLSARGLTSFFAALCYAELGAMVPVAGSAYTYAYATMGKLFAWIIGFALIFEYGISAAPVAQQFSAAIQDVLKTIGWSCCPTWAQQSNLHHSRAVVDARSWDLLALAVRRRRRALRASAFRSCSRSAFANRRRPTTSSSSSRFRRTDRLHHRGPVAIPVVALRARSGDTS